MKAVLLLPTLLILASAWCASGVTALAEGATSTDQCVPLSSITALSLQQGVTTGRRRTANVPKLSCNGNCPENAFVTSAQCTQTGMSDNGLPSWKCVGDFPGATRRERFAFGSIRVQCEGCTQPGDTNVARDSCALTYSVRRITRQGGRNIHRESRDATMGDFMLLTLVILGIVACCYCSTRANRQQHAYEGVAVGPDGKPLPGTHHHHHGGGGGGYGGGGGGFGTGMFTGFLMGDMLGRMSSPGYYGGGYGGGGYDDGYDAGYDDGGGSWGGDGGFGGTDTV